MHEIDINLLDGDGKKAQELTSDKLLIKALTQKIQYIEEVKEKEKIIEISEEEDETDMGMQSSMGASPSISNRIPGESYNASQGSIGTSPL